MEPSFCIHCGKKLTEGSEFCNSCGKSVYKKGMEMDEPDIVQGKPKPSVYQKIKENPKMKISTVIIIALIVTPLVIMGIIGAINVDIGTLNFEVESFDELNMNLIIYNSVGVTEIHYDSTITNLFEATIYVKGKPGADISNAVNFMEVNDTGKIIVSFDSGNYNSWNWKSFQYNIIMRVHTSALVDFDLEGSTGAIVLDLEGYDKLNLKDVQLQVSTGNIQFYSGTAIGTSMEDVRLQSSTGNVDFDFVNAINTTMTDFWSYCTTGELSFFFGERTIIDDPTATIQATTGDIEIQIDEMIYIHNFTWDVEVSTGKINMYIGHEIVSPDITVDFNIEATTGRIDIESMIDTDIGMRIHASATTGSIDIPGSGTFYESAGYDSAEMKFIFYLSTTTGNIDMYET